MLQTLQYMMDWPDFAEFPNSQQDNVLRLARARHGDKLYGMHAAFLKQRFAV